MINFFKVIIALRAVGYSFSKIGELLSGLGKAVGDANLASPAPPGPGPQEMSQDFSNSLGEENEEPEERQGKLL